MGTVVVSDSAAVSQSCEITLNISADGFVDRVFAVRFWVVKDSDTAWADYVPEHGTFYVGESLRGER